MAIKYGRPIGFVPVEVEPAANPAAALDLSSRPRRNRRGTQPIEIEVRTPQELEQAIAHGAEAILLDNMSVEDVKKSVEFCSNQNRRLPLECSGGITLENVRAYAQTGVDFISVGALTHSVQAVDLSLRVAPV